MSFFKHEQPELHEPHDDSIPAPSAHVAGADQVLEPGFEHPPRGRVGILRPLKIKDFALLWSGMTISLIGDGIYLVAIAFQVYDISNSPTALSLVFFAWTAPMVIFFLMSGVLTDRMDRRWMMIAADVIRGGSLGILGWLSVTGNLTLGWMFVFVALYGIGDAFFMPAFTAIVPDIVPEDLLLEANSLDSFVRPLTMRMIGPALGGILVATLGPGRAIIADAVTFGASALCVIFIAKRPRPEPSGTSPLKELAEGFRFVRSKVWLWATLASASVSLLAFFGPMEVLIPYVVKNDLGGDAGDYGWLLTAGGIGAAIVSALMGQRGMPKRHITVMYVSWGFGVLLIAAFAFTSNVGQAIFIGALMSPLFTVGMIIWTTLMHKLVPAELMGRVSSLDWMVSTSLLPVSFLLTGPVSEAIGVDATLIGAGVAGFLLTIAFLLVPGIHDTEKDGSITDAAPTTEERDPAVV